MKKKNKNRILSIDSHTIEKKKKYDTKNNNT